MGDGHSGVGAGRPRGPTFMASMIVQQATGKPALQALQALAAAVMLPSGLAATFMWEFAAVSPPWQRCPCCWQASDVHELPWPTICCPDELPWPATCCLRAA